MSEDYKNTRVSKRVTMRCMVKYGPLGRLLHTALSTDISDTGIWIKAVEIYEKETKLSMSIVAMDDKTYKAEGIVMWAKKAPPGLSSVVKCGMGVKFTSIDPGFIEFYNSKK